MKKSFICLMQSRNDNKAPIDGAHFMKTEAIEAESAFKDVYPEKTLLGTYETSSIDEALKMHKQKKR